MILEMVSPACHNYGGIFRAQRNFKISATANSRLEQLRATKSEEQPVRRKLDVPRHELAVHTDEVARRCFTDEAALEVYGIADNTTHRIFRKLVPNHTVHQICNICRQLLIA